jgi:hypothetical protein
MRTGMEQQGMKGPGETYPGLGGTSNGGPGVVLLCLRDLAQDVGTKLAMP